MFQNANFFVTYSDLFYIICVGTDGLCFTWPHSIALIHSVGLVWMEDRPVAETSTWQYTTLTGDRYSCPGGIRNRNPSQLAAEGLRPRPQGHRDRQNAPFPTNEYITMICHFVRGRQSICCHSCQETWIFCRSLPPEIVRKAQTSFPTLFAHLTSRVQLKIGMLTFFLSLKNYFCQNLIFVYIFP